ncbi:hypothetical protein K439DRAFT_1610629 [Ramaria rubella]|nr:hypothetical protein K439DRAFT_1610629 [Ramaria rubella]
MAHREEKTNKQKTQIHVLHQSMTKAGPSHTKLSLCKTYAVENHNADLLETWLLSQIRRAASPLLLGRKNANGPLPSFQLINIDVDNATIAKVSGRKGIVLMTCGSAMTFTNAFSNLCNYMQMTAFQFAIGFTAPGIIPGNAMLPLVAAIHLIYLFDTPPLLAVEKTFGGGGQALHHSGVIIVTRDEEGNITA